MVQGLGLHGFSVEDLELGSRRFPSHLVQPSPFLG